MFYKALVDEVPRYASIGTTPTNEPETRISVNDKSPVEKRIGCSAVLLIGSFQPGH